MKTLLKTLLIKGLLQFGLKAGINAKTPKYIAWRLLAAMLIMLAAIFALIAGHGELSSRFGNIQANWFFAAGFAALSLCMLIAISIAKRQHTQQSPLQQSLDQVDQFAQHIKGQAQEAGAQVQQTLRQHSGKALLGAAIIGIILGSRRRK